MATTLPTERPPIPDRTPSRRPAGTLGGVPSDPELRARRRGGRARAMTPWRCARSIRTHRHPTSRPSAAGDAATDDATTTTTSSSWRGTSGRSRSSPSCSAVALIGGMVGWLIADASHDERGSDVDVGFLQDMRVHHEQAVQMAFTYLALADTDPGLQSVARTHRRRPGDRHRADDPDAAGHGGPRGGRDGRGDGVDGPRRCPRRRCPAWPPRTSSSSSPGRPATRPTSCSCS